MTNQDSVPNVTAARKIATAWAYKNNKNEGKCLAAAEVWFDAKTSMPAQMPTFDHIWRDGFNGRVRVSSPTFGITRGRHG